MHCKHPVKLFTLGLIFTGSLLLGGCASTQTPLPADTRATPQQEEGAKTSALGNEDDILSGENPLQAARPDPWKLVEQAAGQPAEVADSLLLEAAELFLDQQLYSTAYSMLEEIDKQRLTEEQQFTHSLLQARYAMLSGDTARATQMTTQLSSRRTMSPENYIRLLELNATIAAQQLDFRRAVLMRLKLDALLSDGPRINNQRRILSTLERETRLFEADQADSLDSSLPGWLALADLSRTQGLNESTLFGWQQQFPAHPAQVFALSARAGNNVISSRQIALLLPFTSRLGQAAQAFKAGFDAAIEKSGGQTNYQIYDTGAEPTLTGFYYQSAINDGADFVIGPLGRGGVQSLLDYLGETSVPNVSTLVLGELSSGNNATPNLWGLSLSPEQDAAAVAERAIAQGFRSALLMEKNSPWGQRLSEAFVREFESRGGVVAGRQKFEPGQADHTADVKKLLNISSSEQRRKRLQTVLGQKLKFSVRRRNDVDFIFLAGNAQDARYIVPLAKFYRAHDLPIYATSSAFTGKFNKLSDEDLKGLEFTDLPWLLDGQLRLQAEQAAKLKALADAKAAAERPQQENPDIDPADAGAAQNTLRDTRPPSNVIDDTPAPLPYSSATLNRLYALGVAAYQTIPQLGYLQADNWYRFDTDTLSLTMDSARNLRHRVAWGKYGANGISVK